MSLHVRSLYGRHIGVTDATVLKSGKFGVAFSGMMFIPCLIKMLNFSERTSGWFGKQTCGHRAWWCYRVIYSYKTKRKYFKNLHPHTFIFI